MKKKTKQKIKKALLALSVLVIAFSPLPILFYRYEFSEIFNLWTCLFLIIWFFVGIIIHEAGHLIFGLLTGYRFISFQVGKTLIQKPTNKPLRVKRIPFNGLGGQCLMIQKDKEKSIQLVVHPYWWDYEHLDIQGLLTGLETVKTNETRFALTRGTKIYKQYFSRMNS